MLSVPTLLFVYFVQIYKPFSIEKIKTSMDKQPISELINNGHEQSIWDISFSHPDLGNYIASCGYDNKLIIWKENKSNPNIYENIYY